MRSANATELTVYTPDGNLVIQAKALLVAFPPLLSSLSGFDLTPVEGSLFSKWYNSSYFCGILNNSGIPDNVRLMNAAQNTLYNVPHLPGIYGIEPTSISGMHTFEYGSPTPIQVDTVKADILAAVQRLKTAGIASSGSGETDIVACANPTLFNLQVSAEDISNGFYDEIYNLQGQQSTWWTGATWFTQNSGTLWNFTEGQVLPGLLAALE